ncbi:hypothetical protein ON010_g8816 [Phytophthora cinnamomi]|nr:hypothetical protein ON010_g8816 [Phytophthora cinnamomi]
MLDPKVDKDRGSMKQVNIISNADDSSTTTVLRRIKQDRVGFEAPTCVSEYNAAMQGVDRHDQLRGRFSIADGHSFKKWHKKVAMSAIDIARCNAYICHGLAAGGLNNDGGSDSSHCEDSNVPQGRDPHRVFVAELVRELFDGSWKKWLSPAEGIAYAGEDPTSTQVIQALSESNRSSVTESAVPICVAKESSVILKNRSRAKPIGTKVADAVEFEEVGVDIRSTLILPGLSFKAALLGDVASVKMHVSSKIPITRCKREAYKTLAVIDTYENDTPSQQVTIYYTVAAIYLELKHPFELQQQVTSLDAKAFFSFRDCSRSVTAHEARAVVALGVQEGGAVFAIMTACNVVLKLL